MRIGPAVVAAVLAVAGDAWAQQAPAPPPPAETPRRLTFETAFPPPPEPVTAETTTAPRLNGWAPQLEVTLTCPSCDDEFGAPRVGVAPQWTLHGKASVGNDSHRLSVGLAVQRNVRMPMILTETIGGTALPEPRSSFSSMGDTYDRFQATIQYERRLWRSGNGTTLDFVGEAFVPIVPWGNPKDAPARPRNPAGRAGLRLRF